jgi:hypothetical protein
MSTSPKPSLPRLPLTEVERDLQRANIIIALQMIVDQLTRIANYVDPILVAQKKGEVELGIASYGDRELREQAEEFSSRFLKVESEVAPARQKSPRKRAGGVS